MKWHRSPSTARRCCAGWCSPTVSRSSRPEACPPGPPRRFWTYPDRDRVGTHDGNSGLYRRGLRNCHHWVPARARLQPPGPATGLPGRERVTRIERPATKGPSMGDTRRRGAVVLGITGLVAPLTLALGAAPAQAASCTTSTGPYQKQVEGFLGLTGRRKAVRRRLQGCPGLPEQARHQPEHRLRGARHVGRDGPDEQAEGRRQ